MSDIEAPEGTLRLTLLPHPSHLMVVGPVALGLARATRRDQRFATSSGFLVSSATLPPKTLPEVANYARSHPGLAAATVMGAAHTTFTTKLLAKQAGLEIVTVPYQGAAQHMPDLWEGRVALSTISGNLSCSALTDPKLRAIAPDVPTTAEVGSRM